MLFWMLFFISISFLIIVGYFIRSINTKHDKHIIVLTESSKKVKTVIKSELKTPYKLIVTLKGSFSDTIFFDGKKIPPPEIDKIMYDYDWYSDSAWFYFDAYKATKVDLKVTFSFYQ